MTRGERHSGTPVQALLEGLHAHTVQADTGDDVNELVNWIQQTGALVVIPPRSNRTVLRNYDNARYTERNRVERMWGDLKHFRHVATRYEKPAHSFLSLVQLVASFVWLK